MKLKVAEQIFTILDQNNPNPTTELIYKTPFQLVANRRHTLCTSDRCQRKQGL